MSEPAYTPGWSPQVSAFMERRTAQSHAAAMLALLEPGRHLLDLGCGPGSITVGLARAVAPGRVAAIDREPSQIRLLEARAAREGLANIDARAGDAMALDLEDDSVDAAWAHALLEHLPDPAGALREMARVVRPGGPVVAVSPDWGGFVLAPPVPEADAAIARYQAIQRGNGGDVRAGRELGLHMAAAGLHDITVSARYECYDDRAAIADYLATTIERSPGPDDARLARALRAWSALPGGMFAQAWVTAVGRVAPR